MPRINRSLSDPNGQPTLRVTTRDRKKRQAEHDWIPNAFDDPRPRRRPTLDDLTEEAKEWDNNPLGDWPDV